MGLEEPPQTYLAPLLAGSAVQAWQSQRLAFGECSAVGKYEI